MYLPLSFLIPPHLCKKNPNIILGFCFEIYDPHPLWEVLQNFTAFEIYRLIRTRLYIFCIFIDSYGRICIAIYSVDSFYIIDSYHLEDIVTMIDLNMMLSKT